MDLSTLSDDQLKSLYAQPQASPLAGMSDEQLKAAYAQSVPLPPQRPQQSVTDKLLGNNGPRYQTWPERMVRGLAAGIGDAATLPHDVMQEAQQQPQTISDSDVSRLSVPSAMNLASVATPVNPAVRAGDQAIPGVANNLVPQKVAAPTTEQLAQRGAQDIQAAKNSGLAVTSSSIGDLSRKIQQDLFDAGVHPTQAQNTYAILKDLENAPPGSYATAANLQSLRESLRGVAQNFNPNAAKDQLAASRAIRGLDAFIPNVAPQDVLAGTPAATADLFQTGHGNYAAAMRSNDLTGVLDRANTGILERAQVRAQAANSGRNLDNTIRQKVAALLEKPKEVSGFSDQELQALNDVVQGGPVRNAARYAGNLLGGGGGMGQAVIGGIGAAGGATAGGPVGAVLGATAPVAAGSASKMLANALAKHSLNQADEMVRMNSPLYQEMVASAPLIPANLNRNAAVAKALLMSAMENRR